LRFLRCLIEIVCGMARDIGHFLFWRAVLSHLNCSSGYLVIIHQLLLFLLHAGSYASLLFLLLASLTHHYCLEFGPIGSQIYHSRHHCSGSKHGLRSAKGKLGRETLPRPREPQYLEFRVIFVCTRSTYFRSFVHTLTSTDLYC
jgi:hypothetical protein